MPRPALTRNLLFDCHNLSIKKLYININLHLQAPDEIKLGFSSRTLEVFPNKQCWNPLFLMCEDKWSLEVNWNGNPINTETNSINQKVY